MSFDYFSLGLSHRLTTQNQMEIKFNLDLNNDVQKSAFIIFLQSTGCKKKARRKPYEALKALDEADKKARTEVAVARKEDKTFKRVSPEPLEAVWVDEPPVSLELQEKPVGKVSSEVDVTLDVIREAAASKMPLNKVAFRKKLTELGAKNLSGLDSPDKRSAFMAFVKGLEDAR